MGGKLSAEGIARRRRAEPGGRSYRLLCALALLLLASGCAASGATPGGEQDRHRGFYGGISGGGVLP